MTPLDCEAPEWFRTALSAEVTEGQLIVNGCQIAFRQWGDRADPGVVLIHGGRAHSRWWDHVGPLLSSEYCVSAIDLSGHGDSGRRSTYGWEQWAQEVLALASAMSNSPTPPVIVGHSMGGRVAAKAAANPGSLLSGLILVDSAPGTMPPLQQTASVGTDRQSVRFYPTEDEARARFRLVPGQSAALPYIFDHVARTSIRQTADGWTWKFDPNTATKEGEINAETLARIRCRVALLRAEFGRVTPSARDQFERSLGRSIPVVEIPQAHHHVMMDQPLSLVVAIRILLAEWEHTN